jgi:hypothetical protein
MGAPILLRDTRSFKGYPASVETMPSSLAQVPCIFGDTIDAASGGNAAIVFANNPSVGSPPPPPPPPRPPPPPPGGTVLFSDDFNRVDAFTMGAQWKVATGAWVIIRGFGASGLNGGDRALVANVSCADCRIDAEFNTFGTEAGYVLRAQPDGDRYEMALTSSGVFQIRRIRAGTVTVLGQVASGIFSTFDVYEFSVQGTGPVTLTASINGVTRLHVEDTTAQAIGTAGQPGLMAKVAGVPFDNLVVTALGQ